jgi:uncharacterized SAM-binding protein YcdF (DUF218 family)
MIELGIPANDILVENASKSTFENALFSKRITDSLHLQPPFVLVTSAMHVPRAERVFKKAGLPVIPFPCNYYVIDTKFDFADYFVPAVGTIFSWSTYLKEVVGLIGYKVFGKV